MNCRTQNRVAPVLAILASRVAPAVRAAEPDTPAAQPDPSAEAASHVSPMKPLRFVLPVQPLHPAK